MIPDVFGLRGLAMGVGGGLLVGTFAGGWLVHELWLGKAARADNERLELALTASTESARIAREGKDTVIEINATLRASLATYSDQNSALSQANTALAVSRAPRIETIYREAERFANDTFDPDNCARQPVDQRLLDYIWPAKATATSLRLAGATGPT